MWIRHCQLLRLRSLLWCGFDPWPRNFCMSKYGQRESWAQMRSRTRDLTYEGPVEGTVTVTSLRTGLADLTEICFWEKSSEVWLWFCTFPPFPFFPSRQATISFKKVLWWRCGRFRGRRHFCRVSQSFAWKHPFPFRPFARTGHRRLRDTAPGALQQGPVGQSCHRPPCAFANPSPPAPPSPPVPLVTMLFEVCEPVSCLQINSFLSLKKNSSDEIYGKWHVPTMNGLWILSGRTPRDGNSQSCFFVEACVVSNRRSVSACSPQRTLGDTTWLSSPAKVRTPAFSDCSLASPFSKCQKLERSCWERDISFC